MNLNKKFFFNENGSYYLLNILIKQEFPYNCRMFGMPVEYDEYGHQPHEDNDDNENDMDEGVFYYGNLTTLNKYIFILAIEKFLIDSKESFLTVLNFCNGNVLKLAEKLNIFFFFQYYCKMSRQKMQNHPRTCLLVQQVR